jgi:hypothetical protein
MALKNTGIPEGMSRLFEAIRLQEISAVQVKKLRNSDTKGAKRIRRGYRSSK